MPVINVLGCHLASGKPGGREEPMNRLGHAPAVAWILAMGADRGGGDSMRDCARAALQWQIDHPGRYEFTMISLQTGPAPVTIYDPASGEELLASASGRQPVRMPGDTARVLVLHPAGARRETHDGMIFAHDSMVGGCFNPALPNHSPRIHPTTR
jgi:hypothetical protein